MENERVEQGTIKIEETRKQPSKSEVIGSFIGMGMVGFWFGIGLMLAVKTVNNLECCFPEVRNTCVRITAQKSPFLSVV